MKERFDDTLIVYMDNHEMALGALDVLTVKYPTKKNRKYSFVVDGPMVKGFNITAKQKKLATAICFGFYWGCNSK
jgi:hypothetical protein